MAYSVHDWYTNSTNSTMAPNHEEAAKTIISGCYDRVEPFTWLEGMWYVYHQDNCVGLIHRRSAEHTPSKECLIHE